VTYDGILPDMFREGTSVIATGRIREGRLVADEVLAKHDEQYMPAEVADAIAAAKAKDAAKPGAGASGAAVPAAAAPSSDAGAY
jgi:cytochrome c-type biogenesis protein CcmE